MKRISSAFVCFTLIALGLLSIAPGAVAQNLDEHFAGKTMRLLWPGAPGGDRGQYAYPFMKYFGRHLPGNPTMVPTFMPGAGGATMVNYLYSIAAPDGLTLGTPLAPVVIAQATGSSAVKYDVLKMTWIGRISDATRVLWVTGKSGITSLDDLKTREVVVGSTGTASETYINPAVMNSLLGTKFKIVTGYKVLPEVVMAPERGETDGAFGTWNNIGNLHAAKLKTGEFKILLQIAPKRHRDLPNIPLLLDMAPNEEARQVIAFMTSSSDMGQNYAAPPSVPEHIVAALRKAFDATMKDPDFVAELEKGNIELNPAGGVEVTEIVKRTMGLPKAAIARYQQVVGAD